MVFLLLFLIYPLSNVINEDRTSLFSGFISESAGYLLPFYLYIFLSLLLLDILLLLNRLFRVIPEETIHGRRFRKAGLPGIIIFSFLIVIAGVINFNTIRITNYLISVPAKSSQERRLRIAFASDFHLQEGTSIKFVKRFIDKIKEIKPDLMLYGGDIVEGDRKGENMTRIEQFLHSVRARYGVFGVPGNHEHYAGQDQGSFFRNAGIGILSDSVIIFDRSFILAGRNDSHIRSRKSVDELLQNIPDSLPLLLLDHRPTEIDQISKTSADIVLSGHTHNGQLFPINLITKTVYELSWGHLKKGNTHFFVSSGIRLWGPRVRTTGKSEIVVIDVIFTR